MAANRILDRCALKGALVSVVIGVATTVATAEMAPQKPLGPMAYQVVGQGVPMLVLIAIITIMVAMHKQGKRSNSKKVP